MQFISKEGGIFTAKMRLGHNCGNDSTHADMTYCDAGNRRKCKECAKCKRRKRSCKRCKPCEEKLTQEGPIIAKLNLNETLNNGLKDETNDATDPEGDVNKVFDRATHADCDAGNCRKCRQCAKKEGKCITVLKSCKRSCKRCRPCEEKLTQEGPIIAKHDKNNGLKDETNDAIDPEGVINLIGGRHIQTEGVINKAFNHLLTFITG